MKLKVVESGPYKNRGWFSYFNQAIYALKSADRENVPLMIDFVDTNLHPDNIWDFYFYQPFVIENLSDYEIERKMWFDTYCQFFLDQNHIDEFNCMVNKYVVVKPKITQIVDDFTNKYFLNKNILVCHKRGTDHSLHGDMLSLQYYFEKVDLHIDKYDLLYLATDEQQTLDAFKNRYRNKVIYYDCMRSENGIAIHHGIGKQDPYKMGEDVVVDCLLMSKGSHLLKTASNISHAVLYFNNKMTWENIDAHINYI